MNLPEKVDFLTLDEGLAIKVAEAAELKLEAGGGAWDDTTIYYVCNIPYKKFQKIKGRIDGDYGLINSETKEYVKMSNFAMMQIFSQN